MPDEVCANRLPRQKRDATLIHSFDRLVHHCHIIGTGNGSWSLHAVV